MGPSRDRSLLHALTFVASRAVPQPTMPMKLVEESDRESLAEMYGMYGFSHKRYAARYSPCLLDDSDKASG